MIEVRNDMGKVLGSIDLIEGWLIYDSPNEHFKEFLRDLIENDLYLTGTTEEKYKFIPKRFSNLSRMFFEEVGTKP